MIQSPLPVKDGVNATRLRLPAEGPWETVLEYVLERFGHVDPESMRARFLAGEIVDSSGRAVTDTTPLGSVEAIWYYRSAPRETPIPFDVTVLHEDERLLVADKPPFLPTTPGGRFVQQSALVRLRRKHGLPELTPLHRLDRLTWGVVLFAKRAEDRGLYQRLFEERRIEKRYEAIAPHPGADIAEAVDGDGLHVRSRLLKARAHLRAYEEPGAPNAHTEIHREQPLDAATSLYRLTPHTGKTHQLRLHMAGVGLGIIGDPFYPDLLDEAPDDYARPLRLLARSVEFTDPVTGAQRRFESALRLDRPPEPCPRMME
ncbi:pseudouridine synthase [Falsarthrobacter nasiphocae]|uniref:RNA pseudouridylate synthase n=1 Tax=Falsarthrobacter nasiphocae TaxID=189863 RepID=A0AAE4C7X2_9MICC|nr:pseudouridine synthase [Falsarthrobacter nasiphocae]MDR6891820.1 tRNA pseudouridine32 synthase/23S rRNA pseudouridine746 synthase [Falsarthrobacter nasiphocae]